MDVDLELKKLRTVYPSAEIWPDNVQKLVYLPDLKVRSGKEVFVTDALLYPYPRDGYSSRLFFKDSFPNNGQKWSVFNICGKTWYACSWQGILNTVPFAEMISGHLRAIK